MNSSDNPPGELILALDTSHSPARLSLGKPGVAALVNEVVEGESTELASLIAQLLSQAEISIADLRCVSVSLGPGSFTGLRVGLAFAKGLVAHTGLSLIGVTKVEQMLQELKEEPLLALFPMKRDSLYCWSANEPGEKHLTIMTNPDLLIYLQKINSSGEPGVVACIDFAVPADFNSLSLENLEFVSLQLPVQSLIDIAAKNVKALKGDNNAHDWIEMEPVYVGKSSAEVMFERRQKEKMRNDVEGK